MSEYIGSRISLISKSDIKYVGTLKSIDSETATVSLQEVQCHGTEGRKADPAQEIPGSDVIYDGIVFRGSDVKDLTILAPPKENRPPQMPNDPAILGSGEAIPSQHSSQPRQPPPQQPPQNQFRGPPPPQYQQQQQFGYPNQPPNQFQQQPRFQQPGGPHGFPGQPGAVPGYGMGYGPPPPPPGYGGMGMGYGMPNKGFPGHPGPFSPQQQPIGPPGPQMNQQQPSQQMPSAQRGPVGSKQQTPQPPTNNQAPQPPVSQPQVRPVEMSSSPAPPAIAPPPPTNSKPSVAAATAPSIATQAPPAPTVLPAKAPQKSQNTRVAIPLPATGPTGGKSQPKSVAPAQQAPTSILQPPRNATNATEAATAAVAAAMAKLGSVNQAGGDADGLTQRMTQLRVRDSQPRGRGRGRGEAREPRGGRRESQPKNIDVPKEDFDFETANAKFNKQELVKEAIASGSPITSPTNGTVEDPLISATNGHIDGADDVVIPPKPTDKSYDKKSSFFDNISSDLRDRVEQQHGGTFVDGRAMRREEQSKNMETFGQGSVDSGYRGRGRGRGRGFGRGGRGFEGGRGGYDGYRGTYRGRGRGGAEAPTT